MFDANPNTRLSSADARDKLADILHHTPPTALLIEPVITSEDRFVA